MYKRILQFGLILIAVGVGGAAAYGQTADTWDPFPDNRREKEDDRFLKQMLAKQRTEQEKKEYEEMLERGSEAVAIAEDLDKAFLKNGTLSRSERSKLDDLEKLVRKIRDGLGGDDDNDDEPLTKERKPADLKQGFQMLRSTTEKLVDEVKRSTRFAISVAAIESSNSVIKVIKFLRLKD